MKKKSILSIILSTALLFTTIFASLPAIVADEDPMVYLQSLVEQWEDEPGDDYTAESYAALQAALANAKAVVEAGVPDGAIVTRPVVGGYDDPNWQVLEPRYDEGVLLPGEFEQYGATYQMVDGRSNNYSPVVNQETDTDNFPGGPVVSVTEQDSGVNISYLSNALGRYLTGHASHFGDLHIRYALERPMPIDFTTDQLKLNYAYSLNPSYGYIHRFELFFEEDIPPLPLHFIKDGDTAFWSLYKDCPFDGTIDLSAFYNSENQDIQNYVNTYLAPRNGKVNLKAIKFWLENEWTHISVNITINEVSLIGPSRDFAYATAWLEAAIAGLEIDYPRLLQDLVEQWEDEPIGVYTAESYAALQAALAKANAAIASGKPDSIETVSIVGGPSDPNWEVKNPYDMEPGYTPKDQQIATFGANHMEFVPWGAQLVRCTYIGGQGRYGVGGQFGEIDFRYNRSANPLELNFKSDSISMNFRSGFTPDYPPHAVKLFTIVLSFEEDIPDISIPWIISGDSYATPGSDSYYINEINLADLLTKDYAQEYVNTYLAPLDYKVHVEYLRIDQDVDYNGDPGLSFVINDFTLTDVNTDFADAYNELLSAIDGLELAKGIILHDGAKIRTSEPQGLMFGTMVDSDAGDLYIASGYTPTVYGTVLLPENLIPVGEELTKETAKAVYKEFDANEYPNLAEYKVYLIGWTTELQMTRNITARSYVVYEKEGADPITVYSSNTVTRSVYTVAINIYNEESGNPPLENNLENGRIAYNWLISGV